VNNCFLVKRICQFHRILLCFFLKILLCNSSFDIALLETIVINIFIYLCVYKKFYVGIKQLKGHKISSSQRSVIRYSTYKIHTITKYISYILHSPFYFHVVSSKGTKREKNNEEKINACQEKLKRVIVVFWI